MDGLRRWTLWLIASVGPYDGIMGFSQGAAFGALLSAMSESEETLKQLRFAVLISGFVPRAKDLQSRYFDAQLPKFKLPSLHIIGETDVIIKPDKSQQLVERFERASVLRHGGGHFVCGNRQTTLPVVREFLQQFIINPDSVVKDVEEEDDDNVDEDEEKDERIQIHRPNYDNKSSS
jgi:pimeloyl-ACP methyl ester carboxylesterase